uniref:Microsomal glutathione S-transferase 2 n=1 Tax=Oncorhynchus tshawytscha TaxID=74940 RepID=A0A8C8CMQ5_ONCTS
MTTEISVLLAVVSLFSALQMGYLARQVGLARMTHKVMPPTVTGPPEFERTFRAHQNNVELYPVFLVVLWTSGLLFSEVLAVLGGGVYMVARHMYFSGYVMSTKKSTTFNHFLGLCGVLVSCSPAFQKGRRVLCHELRWGR